MYLGGICKQKPPLYAAALFLLFAHAACAETTCADAVAFTHSTVSFTKRFNEDERKQHDPALLGIRGTAWFLSSRSMATAAHVAQSMELSDKDWNEAEIERAGFKQPVFVRIQSIAGSEAEKIAVIELKSPIPDAQPLQIRTAPLTAGEPVTSLGYPRDRLRFASGRFVRYGDDGELAGRALFELSDGDDRLALDHGASGAPVLDCEGRVAAVVSNVFARTMSFLSQPIRVSTAWGSPNVAAVPITVLEDHTGR